ncbi:MAG TPA: hypothetical protein VFV84_06000, partial [Burkholderiales bacterium]|nr:hypothetical protein [Burkholderiales bacterium]
IATGPELSKDITREEAREGMRLVLDGEVDPVQAGVFLIALRMKRETDEENLGLLDAIRAATLRTTAPVDEVLDLGDPYDGYARTLPAAPFLPAVLAACGVPAITHGVERMGPKFGLTHRQVLAAAGAPVDLALEEAAARLADPRTGWAYVDQRVFCPKLHALARLRTLIVKRPAVTTLEVLAGPVRGRRRTHLVTGYVHKAYPRVYALLAREAGFDSALIVRGIEGGVIPTLAGAGKAFRQLGKGDPSPVEFTSADFGLEARATAERRGGDPAQAAAQGLAALGGEPGPTRDALVCGAALCLWHLGRQASLRAAADCVRGVLDRGDALARLHQAK